MARMAMFAKAVLLTVPFHFWAGVAMAQDNSDVMKVAQEFISSRYPSFNADGLDPIISERGNLWRVTYRLPQGTLGGGPTVIIDKKTCEVVSSQHSQ
jgi:hypothetical protein